MNIQILLIFNLIFLSSQNSLNQSKNVKFVFSTIRFQNHDQFRCFYKTSQTPIDTQTIDFDLLRKLSTFIAAMYIHLLIVHYLILNNFYKNCIRSLNIVIV